MPKGATLIYNPVSAAPGFIIKNVYVLPGVPMILKPMVLEYLTNYFTINILPQVRISTKLSEGIIGEFIGQIQKNNKQVTIGSYPYFKNDNFGVSLIMKSENRKILNQVSKKVYSYLKKKSGNPKYF